MKQGRRRCSVLAMFLGFLKILLNEIWVQVDERLGTRKNYVRKSLGLQQLVEWDAE
jgi:hypothetical protein